MLPRALPLALLLGCASGSPAVEPPLPAIFAEPAGKASLPRVENTRSSLNSPRLAGLVADAILARAQVFASSGPTLPVAESRAVEMEKFVVRAGEVRPVELSAPNSAFARFLRRGRLFEDNAGKVSVTADLKLLDVGPVGALPKETTRVELRFEVRW